MKKKFLHDFESYRSESKIKEGISIYELEDEATSSEPVEQDVADLDADTPAPVEADAPVEAPMETSTDVVAEVPTEDTLDFGDGDSISQETSTSELEFVAGLISQYQKLAKRETKFDASMKAKIRKAFEILK